MFHRTVLHSAASVGVEEESSSGNGVLMRKKLAVSGGVYVEMTGGLDYSYRDLRCDLVDGQVNPK